MRQSKPKLSAGIEVIIIRNLKVKSIALITLAFVGIAAAYLKVQISTIDVLAEKNEVANQSKASGSKIGFNGSGLNHAAGLLPAKLGSGSTVLANNAGINYDADVDRGWFDIQFNNLPLLTDARFANTGTAYVYSATATAVSSVGVGTASPLRVAAEGVVTESGQLRAYAEVRPSSSSAIAEVLVTDSTSGATICYAVAARGAIAICDTTFTVSNCPGGGCARTYNVYGSNSASSPANLVLRAGMMDPVDQYFFASGPTKAAANSIVKVRLYHNLRVVPRNVEQMTFLKVYSSPGVLIREFPVFTKWNGSTAAVVLPLSAPGFENDYFFTFVDRSELDKVIFDVPVNATSVTFTARHRSLVGILAKPVEDVDLYLIAPSGPNADPVVSAGNPAAVTHSATTSDPAPSNSETITLNNPTPGRWQVIAKTKSGLPTNIRVGALFNTFSAAPDFKFGHYYNPSRSGHGLYLDKVAGQWVMIWYTYLEDGTPTWYYAQADAPNALAGNSLWEASLSRVVWNGTSQFKYPVGFVNVALLGDSSFQFTYNIGGETGNETFVRLGAPGCLQSARQNFDVSGLWYSPSKSGFGYSIEPISNQEFSLSYLFDAAGYPRWLFAQKSFVDGTDSLVLKQQSGFCPLCTYRVPTRQDVGQLTRTITPMAGPDNLPGYANISITANFAAPLAGSWNESLPVEFLTTRKACR
jgi:hypothetical protein